MQVVAEGGKGWDCTSVGSRTGGGTEGIITWQMDVWSEEGWLVKVFQNVDSVECMETDPFSEKGQRPLTLQVGDQSPHSDSP